MILICLLFTMIIYTISDEIQSINCDVRMFITTCNTHNNSNKCNNAYYHSSQDTNTETEKIPLPCIWDSNNCRHDNLSKCERSTSM